MVRKMLVVVVVVLLLAGVSYAGMLDELASVVKNTVKATASGITTTVSNLSPGKIVEDAVETSVDAGQKAGEATLGGATNTVGVVSQAGGGKH